MTLVALGLLLGMIGLVWVIIIGIMQEDHQTKRESSRAHDKPLAAAVRGDSNAA